MSRTIKFDDENDDPDGSRGADDSRSYHSKTESRELSVLETDSDMEIIFNDGLEVAVYDQYQSSIKTINKAFDGINSNSLIKDLYNFNRDRSLNVELNKIYSNDYYNIINATIGDESISKPTSPLENGLPPIPQPVKVVRKHKPKQAEAEAEADAVAADVDGGDSDDELELTFEYGFKSKIFSSVRPDLGNTTFKITEKLNINSKDYAYVVLYFPGRTDSSYLLPTLVVGYMLKNGPQSYILQQQGQQQSQKQGGQGQQHRQRQVYGGTRAKVICMITPDVTEAERRTLSLIYDELKVVGYITWDKSVTSKDRRNIQVEDISRGHIDQNNAYSKVLTKLWIFDSVTFPFKKVVLLDSDLFPTGYYDSLFSLQTPAGWLEHQHGQSGDLGCSSWIHDRGSRLRHGDRIPQDLTDSINFHSSDVNASLYVVKPDHQVFKNMIRQLQQRIDPLFSAESRHKGCWAGDRFYPYYLLPEQNFLTTEFSGQWHSIDFGFCTWLVELETCFGFTFAGFVAKPWLVQSIGHKYSINSYSKFSEINNRDSDRSMGYELLNGLIVKTLLFIKRSISRVNLSDLVNIKLVYVDPSKGKGTFLPPPPPPHPLTVAVAVATADGRNNSGGVSFDPWEPEIVLGSDTLINLRGIDQSLMKRLSPDQLLLLLVIERDEDGKGGQEHLQGGWGGGWRQLDKSRAIYLTSLLRCAYKFRSLVRTFSSTGCRRILGYLLKILVDSWKERVSVSDYCLMNGVINGHLDLRSQNLTVNMDGTSFYLNLLPVFKHLLSLKILKVYVYTSDAKIVLLTDDVGNVPLDTLCRFRPPEVKVMKISELETSALSGKISIVGFNISLSEPIYKQLSVQLGISTHHSQNLILDHNHYEYRPYVEVIPVDKISYTGFSYLTDSEITIPLSNRMSYSCLLYTSGIM